MSDVQFLSQDLVFYWKSVQVEEHLGIGAVFPTLRYLMRKGYSIYFIRKKLKVEDQIDISKDEVIKVFEEHQLTEELLIENLIDKKRPKAFKNEAKEEKAKQENDPKAI